MCTADVNYSQKKLFVLIESLYFSSSRVPFNWKMPLGYLFASIVQILTVLSLECSGTPAVILFVGSCWLIEAYVEDIQMGLAKLMPIKKPPKSKSKQVNEIFINIIKDFSHAKQLSKQRTLFKK